MTASDFVDITRTNPFNIELQRHLRTLGLRECTLTAGCLFQTVWNHLCNRPAQWGINDYDVFYFDDADTSWEAEDHVIRQVAAATADLPIRVEVRNQARVHFWFPNRFGTDYPRLHSAREGIDRYLIACTCVGIDVQSGGLYAPNGLVDLAQGRLRLNPLTPSAKHFRQKAESYSLRWPWLIILD